MPKVSDRINIDDLTKALRDRGWAFQRKPSVGLCLTEPDRDKPKFEATGLPRQKALIPVSKQHLGEILANSEGLREAITQVEALSKGDQEAPILKRNKLGQGVDMATVEQMIAKRMTAMEDQMTQLKAERDQSVREARRLEMDLASFTKAALEETPPARKKKAKKVAKKKARKPPKGGVVDRLLKEASTEPELTKEQQETHDALMAASRIPEA